MKQAAERLFFLLDYALLPEEDIKLNNQTFNWPGRMEPIFEVSQQRLAARREKAENEVKERYVYTESILSMLSSIYISEGVRSLRVSWLSTKLRQTPTRRKKSPGIWKRSRRWLFNLISFLGTLKLPKIRQW